MGNRSVGDERSGPRFPPRNPSHERGRLYEGVHVAADGKQLSSGGQPWRARGITYGSFAPRLDGELFPERFQIKKDLTAMEAAGFNLIRTYTPPPAEMLDIAAELGLKVLVGVDYRDWRYEPERGRASQRRVLEAGRKAIDQAIDLCCSRPEVLAISVGNEVPADVVRVHGIRAVEEGLSELIEQIHAADSRMLATYCNFPTTEFLNIERQDIACFNVFLEEPEAFRRYLRHLQVACGDLPLLITELGLSEEIHGEKAQAESLKWQLEIVEEVGCAGATIFSWTDEWAVDGKPVEGWGFGLTDNERRSKPALAEAARWARSSIEDLRDEWPSMSVIVCAYNAQQYLDRCLESLQDSSYPDLEIIVCDDGSTDRTAAIARNHPVQLLALDHVGLSAARNAGINAASGEIVAFLDSDAYCHPHWPYYLALGLEEPSVVGTGGPNLPVEGVGFSERVVAESPGAPMHVLTGDDRAEHVPGCNMAFKRWALEEIGGFNSIYTCAGDDVDVCWKLLDLGYEISFVPAAQVRHHRRDTIRAYLKQQRGYGRAETLVAARHRNRFNRLGQARWSGFIYGGPRMWPSLLRPIIYHGYLGQAPYQSVTARRAEMARMWATALVPFVFAVALAGTLISPVWGGGLVLSLLAALTLLAHLLGIAAGVRPPRHERRPTLFRLAVASMHVAQPLERVVGRLRRIPPIKKTEHLLEWTGDHLQWQRNLRQVLSEKGCTVRVAEPHRPWDFTVSIAPLTHCRITTAVLWGWTPSVDVRYRPRGAALLLGAATIALSFADLFRAAVAGGILLFATGVDAMVLRRKVSASISETIENPRTEGPFHNSPPRRTVRTKNVESIPLFLVAVSVLMSGAVASLYSLGDVGTIPIAAALGAAGIGILAAKSVAGTRQPSVRELWARPPTTGRELARSQKAGEKTSRRRWIPRPAPQANRSLLGRLAGESKPYRWPLIGTSVLALLATPLVLLTPIPLKIAVDSIIGSSPLPEPLASWLPDWATRSDMSLLMTVAALQIGIVVLMQLQEMGAYVASMYTGEKMTLGLRTRLFAHAQRLSLSFHDSRGTTDSIYRIQYDAPSLQYIFVNGVIPLLTAGVTLAAMVYVIFRIDWQVSLVALLICPLLYVFIRRYQERMKPRYHHSKVLETNALKVVQEVLTALRVVKAFGKEDAEKQRFNRDSSKSFRARVKLTIAEGAYGLLVNTATAIGTALVFVIGINAVLSGTMKLGEFLIVVAYVAQLYAPMKTISKTLGTLQSSFAGAERVFELIDEPHEVPESARARRLGRALGHIELRNVVFAYDGTNPVLNDVSFAIEPGQRVGVMGRTGAGKSTLANLLTRFYDPQEGAVLLDGQDIRDYKVADLRNQFSIVLQDTVLFSTTIRENISYALPNATPETILKAAKAANAHEFIREMPDGYDTLVGERGMQLSGGQRQRIALARAFLKNAPILILDEPTSAVDVDTEAEIIEAMERLMAGRTTLIIAHRLQTLQHCDQLLEIEGGRLVGTSYRTVKPSPKLTARGEIAEAGWVLSGVGH